MSKRGCESDGDTLPSKRPHTELSVTSPGSSNSESSEWRQKGNKVYKTVTAALAPSIQEDRLHRALTLYRRARSCATNSRDRSSAVKNCAMTYWKLSEAGIKMQRLPAIISQSFVNALEFFREAGETADCQSVEWQSSLAASAHTCWYSFKEHALTWPYEFRVRSLEAAVVHLMDTTIKAREYLAIASHYFHWSLDAINKKEFCECLRRLADCHYPLEEAKRLGKAEEGIMAEAHLLEEDIVLHRCIAESIQARVRGEEMLNHLLNERETLNMDGVWEVVDLLRQAASLTREHDIELEGIAYSALGKVYHQVLKLKPYARRYLRQALELANSMVPRNFTGVEWYEFAQKTLQEYQTENVREEEAERQRQRETFLKQLKDELFDLEKKFSSVNRVEFLKYVYQAFPPKNPKHVLGEVPKTPEVTDIKKLYQKAVTHYHPDRISEEEHGKKYKVLMEEITKYLTRHYESYK